MALTSEDIPAPALSVKKRETVVFAVGEAFSMILSLERLVSVDVRPGKKLNICRQRSTVAESGSDVRITVWLPCSRTSLIGSRIREGNAWITVPIAPVCNATREIASTGGCELSR
jgi:hypothetical protein